MNEADFRRINQEAWDKRTGVHVKSKFYDVEGFKGGATSLKSIEIELLGDVQGQRFLHLQCHFGLDTLSWSRLGARATGVDFSPAAIQFGRELAQDLELDTQFYCADVLQLSTLSLPPQDIVFSSYGVLLWLPDLDAWAQSLAGQLRTGGRCYLVEFHPIHDFVAGYPYFGAGQAIIEEEGTYTENCPGEKFRMATWSHPISEVVNALIGAGLRIDELKEFPFCPYNCFEGLEERDKGRFFKKLGQHEMPLVFSIRATKL